MMFIRATVLALMIVLVASMAGSPAQAAVSFSFFYSNLSPHGTWLVSAQYGRVWQPYDSGRDWNPYYDGHWVYADVGWTWVSDYEWGDVPYHYGTWFADPVLGWVWVPGYVWAPAWVVFRTGPDYIGWAPVSPRYSVGASFGAAAGPFVFVSAGHFCDPRIRSYVVPERISRAVMNETRLVNNLTVENHIVVNRGPDPRWIERASGRTIQRVRIESVPRIAPGGLRSRSAIAIEPGRGRRELRASQPISGEQPLTAGQQRGTESHGRRMERPWTAQQAPATRPAREAVPPDANRGPHPSAERPHPQQAPARAQQPSRGKTSDHGKPHESKPHGGNPHS